MKTIITGKIIFGLVLTGFLGFSPLYGTDTRSVHLDMNLIIDGSGALSNVMDEVKDWVSQTLDQLLVTGDTITVWSAGSAARIVYSDTIQNDTDREAVKKILQELSAEDDNADFSGALREAGALRGSSGAITYTLLISASAAALSPTLLGPQANLMRFSRVEEFRGWRTMVVGLNIDSKVRQAAALLF